MEKRPTEISSFFVHSIGTPTIENEIDFLVKAEELDYSSAQDRVLLERANNLIHAQKFKVGIRLYEQTFSKTSDKTVKLFCAEKIASTSLQIAFFRNVERTNWLANSQFWIEQAANCLNQHSNNEDYLRIATNYSEINRQSAKYSISKAQGQNFLKSSLGYLLQTENKFDNKVNERLIQSFLNEKLLVISDLFKYETFENRTQLLNMTERSVNKLLKLNPACWNINPNSTDKLLLAPLERIFASIIKDKDVKQKNNLLSNYLGIVDQLTGAALPTKSYIHSRELKLRIFHEITKNSYETGEFEGNFDNFFEECRVIFNEIIKYDYRESLGIAGYPISYSSRNLNMDRIIEFLSWGILSSEKIRTNAIEKEDQVMASRASKMVNRLKMCVESLG